MKKKEKELRTINIFATGQQIETTGVYISTIQIGWFVFHIFEE